MDFRGWSNFEDLAKACGYTKNNTNSNNNNNNNNANIGCSDIPNGFQDLNPQLFVLIGEILGNILAGNMPFNVQNALGNWLQLVGQIIETYNAQQQYFQGGPGRYFDPQNYNVSNSFCNNSQNTNPRGNKSSSKEKSSEENEKIKELELLINELKIDIEEIKREIKK